MILISHAAQRIANSSQQCRARSNKHFKTVFSPVSYSCVVVEAPLQPQCRRDIFLIFVIVSENSTDLPFFFVSPFALFRACCVVVESHSRHSFAIFSGFVVFNIFVRFVL
jgi:hypothetical protein